MFHDFREIFHDFVIGDMYHDSGDLLHDSWDILHLVHTFARACESKFFQRHDCKPTSTLHILTNPYLNVHWKMYSHNEEISCECHVESPGIPYGRHRIHTAQFENLYWTRCSSVKFILYGGYMINDKISWVCHTFFDNWTWHACYILKKVCTW